MLQLQFYPCAFITIITMFSLTKIYAKTIAKISLLSNFAMHIFFCFAIAKRDGEIHSPFSVMHKKDKYSEIIFIYNLLIFIFED